jgi:DNA-directed RNA polymerase specialized sigma24 family protein
MRLSRGASIDELELVYRAAFLRFVRVATAISGNEESGADAVHDAFVQAVRTRRSYRGEGPLEAWVWRMVINAAKKRALTPKQIGHEQAFASENGFGDPVRSLIAALPERQRLALFLRITPTSTMARSLRCSVSPRGLSERLSARRTRRFAIH